MKNIVAWVIGRSIRTQLIVGVATVHLLLMSIFVFDLTQRQKMFLKEKSIHESQFQIMILASGSKEYLRTNDLIGLQEMLETYLEDREIKFAMIVDPNGRILSHSDENLRGLFLQDSVSLSFLRGPSQITQIVPSGEKIEFVAPIIEGKTLLGWARIVNDLSEDQIHIEYVTRQGLLYTIAAILIGTLFAFGLSGVVLRQLKLLMSGAERLGKHQLHTPIPIVTNNEVGIVSKAFNVAMVKVVEGEMMVHRIINLLPIRIFWKDKDLNYLGCNEPFARDAGKSTPAEIAKLDDFKLAWKARAEMYQQDDREVMESGISKINYLEPLINASGKHQWIRTSKIPLTDQSGNTIGILGAYEDVTERKEAEEKLRESEERFKILVQSTDDIIFTLDTEQRHTGVYGRWVEMSGMTNEMFLGKTTREIMGAEYAAVHEAMNQRAIAGESVNYDWTAGNAEDPMFIQTKLSPMKDSTGTIFGIVGVGRNITELKKSETKLRESETRNRSFIEQAPIGVGISRDGITLETNPAYLKMFGYTTQKELFGTPLLNQIAPQCHPDILDRIHRRAAGETIETIYETVGLRKDGSQFPFLISANRILLADGPITISFFTDITERKQIENALKESENKYRNLVENAAVGVFRSKVNGTIEYINNAVATTLEFESSEELKSLGSFVRYKEPHQREELIQQLNNSGWIKNYEANLLTRKGNERIVLFNIVLTGEMMDGTFVDITERKKMEEALLKNEELLKSIVHNSPDLTTLTDENNHLVFISPQCEQILGFRGAEYIGKPLPYTIFPDDAAACQKLWKEIITSDISIQDYEYRIIDSHSTVKWVSHTAKRVTVNGKLFGIQSTIRDISERKRIENALHVSEEKFSKAFYISPDAVSITRLSDGRYYDVNNSFITMSGYSREELINKTSLEMNLWDNPEDRIRVFTLIKDHNEAINQEVVLRLKNNEKIIGLISSRVIDFNGEPFILSIIRDITEQKKSVTALRESENRYRELISTIPDGIYKSSHDGKFLQVNPAMVKILGYETEEELLSIDIITQLYFHTEDRERIAKEEASEKMAIFNLRKKDGSEIWVEDHGRHVIDEKGNILFHEGVLRDITERKKSEKALRENEEKYRSLVENSPDAIAIYVDGKVVFVNNQCTILMGVQNKEELIGRPVIQFVHPDNRPRVIERMKQVAVNGKPLPTEEEKFIRFDGTAIVVEVKAIPTVYENKPAVQIIVHDITERKTMEMALRESEEIFTQLMEHSPIQVFFKDHNIRAIRLSRNFEEMLGRPISELIGKNMDDLFPSDLAKNMVADDMQILNEGKKIEVEEEFNGRSYLTIKFPITIEGKPRYLAGFTIDITERKKAEETLRQLSQAVEQSPVSIVITDTSGKIQYVNSKFKEVTGYTSNETVGKNPRFLKSGHTSQKEYEQLWETILSGDEWHGEFHNKKKDGTLYWESAKISPIVNAQNAVTNFLAIKEDITERKAAEALRRQTEEKFRDLVESTDGIVWEADAQTFIFSFVSKQAERLLGYAIEEWYTKGFWAEHIHLDDKEKAILYCVTCTKEMKSHDFVYRFIAKDGHIVWLRDIVNVVVHDGKPVLLRGLMIDITQQKMMEETLHESAMKLNKAQHQARMGSWTWNVKTNSTEWSEEMYHIFGLTKETCTGELNEIFAKSIHPDDRAKVEASNLSAINHKKQIPLEFRIILPDQSIRVVYAEAGDFTIDEHGNPDVLSGTVQDITERKNDEMIIRDVQRRESIGVLAGGIAHDFNNLLGAMMGNISLAQSRISPDHPAVKNIERTISAIDRAATLTKQMLAYSGKGKFQMREIDLSALVQEHINLFEVSLPKNVQLRSTVSPTPVVIKGDPGQIDQIVMNLIINGGEAIGKNQGTVSIDISSISLSETDVAQYSTLTNLPLKEGSYALLQVSDNGCGMSKETQAKIFDPFFTTKFVGRGLGLSAVLGIIRGNEGGISIQSTEGVGTTFRVVLPLIQSTDPEKVMTNSAANAPIIDNIKILIIDDEQYVVEMAVDILESGKYQHLSAVDPEKGINIFEEQWRTIDLVLLDFSMPKMNGKEVFVELRKIHPEVKVIISSGYTEEEIIELMENDTPNAFIQKPYSQEDLLFVIKRVLESA